MADIGRPAFSQFHQSAYPLWWGIVKSQAGFQDTGIGVVAVFERHLHNCTYGSLLSFHFANF